MTDPDPTHFWDIEGIFDQGRVLNYTQDRDARTLAFEVEEGYAFCTFEHLERLATLVRSKAINLNSSYVRSAGCSSCGHGRSVALPISITDVTLPALNPCFYLHGGGARCGEESTNKTKRLCDTHAPLRCACGKQATRSPGVCRACAESVQPRHCIRCGNERADRHLREGICATCRLST